MLSVSASVTNTGHVAGEEVVQVYIVDPGSWEWGEVLVRPWKRLAAFQRVLLAAG